MLACSTGVNVLRALGELRRKRGSSLRSILKKIDWLRIQRDYSAQVRKIGPSQGSRFFMRTKGSAAPGDENGRAQDGEWKSACMHTIVRAVPPPDSP